jgi:ribosome-binding protein aMBF1 (putative translation factor)
MIRTEAEYREARARLDAERQRLRDQDKQLRAEGLSPAARKRLLDPQRSFSEQLAEEVASYERLKQGDVEELENLHGLGRLLIALRIARGMTQRDLADKLAVHETQVSRDERNEYHGITVDRASRIMDVLKADVRTSVRSSPRGSGKQLVRSNRGGRVVRRARRPTSSVRK